MGAHLPFLLCALLWAASSAARECEGQSMTDVVIDVQTAVSRGARFTDPVKVSGVEECVARCCTQRSRGGDLACNLAVYDARNSRRRQNCYFFHCPEPDSCPMTPAPGVLSYALWTGINGPDPTEVNRRPAPESSDRHTAPGSAGNRTSAAQHLPGSSAPRDRAGMSPAPGGRAEEGDAPGSITTQLLHLVQDIDRHLQDDAEPENPLRVFFPSTTTTKPLPQTKEVSTHRPPPTGAITIPTQPPRTVGVKPSGTTHRAAPPTKPARIAPPTSQDAIKEAGVNEVTRVLPGAKSSEPGPKVKVTQAPDTAPPTRLSPALTRSAALRTSTSRGAKTTHVTDPRPDTGDGETPSHADPSPRVVNLEEAGPLAGAVPRSNRPPLDDRSGLVAALVFGVAFLLAVVALISRKVAETRRRNQYTKLDYLINGMYVDT